MRIGVDVGGTKIEAAVLSGDGKLLHRRRVATPRGYPDAVEAIAALVESREHAVAGKCTVGLGIPGTISPATGLVKNAYNSPFNGHPLDRDLATRLGRPVRLANDANCFALSEAQGGAADGAGVVFGAILGTGCGGGIVIGGSALTGANAIAGEWGHNPLPWPQDDERPGPGCTCGKSGCTETFVSGTGLERDYARLSGKRADAATVVARAADGDATAAKALERYEHRLARALATVINILDPDIVVLGGGMSKVDRLYERVPTLWGEYVFSDRVDTRLVPPVHGDSSGVRGAAWLWPPEA